MTCQAYQNVANKLSIQICLENLVSLRFQGEMTYFIVYLNNFGVHEVFISQSVKVLLNFKLNIQSYQNHDIIMSYLPSFDKIGA
jgi:hypothetical protein